MQLIGSIHSVTCQTVCIPIMAMDLPQFLFRIRVCIMHEQQTSKIEIKAGANCTLLHVFFSFRLIRSENRNILQSVLMVYVVLIFRLDCQKMLHFNLMLIIWLTDDCFWLAKPQTMKYVIHLDYIEFFSPYYQ